MLGQKSDGHQYLQDAVSRGASAAIVQQLPAWDTAFPVIKVPDSRRALAICAQAVAGYPDRELTLVGITGTNGKTTSAMLLAQIFKQAGLPSGLISTVGVSVGDKMLPAERTTPEAPDICELLTRMKQAGCRGATLEVSSHALAQDRVYGLKFAVAAFTNLTQDHLDYHGDMESYFQAKALLFSNYDVGAAVINQDDAYGKRLIRMTPHRVHSYSLHETSADVFGSRLNLQLDGLDMIARTARGDLPITSPLVGRFNAYNVLCALAVAESLGLSQDAMIAGVRQFRGAPGRLEKFDLGARWAYVDYAHTPDALQQALQELRTLSSGPLHVLFGCGGDRDRAKRPLMGRVAEEIADKVYITSDNPREEDPVQITAEIMAGLSRPQSAVLLLDRRAAIRGALQDLPPKGILLIAGKGHEDYQEIHGIKYPFDDRDEIRSYLSDMK
jgi:UDP-N-acetylmuramoyl-L-alanyl-D-glutamate--2,6-diaminopimelate ligase